MATLAAVALLLCAPSHAAPKPRTLKDLIDLARKKGADDEIAAEDAPDKRQHIFDVVLAKPGKPDCITLSAKTESTTVDGDYLDGLWFRASLDGKLLGAMSFEGRSGELFRQELDTKDPKIQALFDKERDFWLQNSLATLKIR